MESGNMAAGVFVGIILMALIGWMPIISILGALIAGIISGAITRGGPRGLGTGFLSALFGLALVAIIFTLSNGAYGGTYGAAVTTGRAGPGNAAFSEIIIIGLVATFGGLVGGLLMPTKSLEVSAKATTVIKTNSAKVTDDDEENEYGMDEGDAGEKKEAEDPLSILKLRYAKGEITKKEYEKIKKDIAPVK